MTVDEVCREVAGYHSRFAVITGGEPMLSPGIEELSAALKALRLHVTIETAGTLFKPVVCDLMSISPKLANSTPWQKAGGRFAANHDKLRLQFSVLQSLLDNYDYQLKFVVERPCDFDELSSVIGKLRHVDASRVLVMAQGTTSAQIQSKAEWIVDLCKKCGYRYSPRLHIDLFGNRRGT
jgi:7-carboxy-7-deazaguanine synthase